MVAATSQADAWEIGSIKLENADAGRVTCGLLQKYGPTRSYRGLSLAIPDSPYGPLRLEMEVHRELRIMADRYKTAPSDAVANEIKAWVTAQVPEKPDACTFLLADQAWLVRVGYPEEPGLVPDAEYVTIQLDLAQQAAAVDPDWVVRWIDGALLAYRALDAKQQRALARDPRMRAGAYTVIDRPAPDGMSDIGRRGYCDLYASVQKLFPPRTAKEKSSLKRARRSLSCR